MAGSIEAIEYLYSLGHRDIAYINGGQTFAGEKRLQGYMQGMQKLGLPVQPQRIVQGSYDYTVESGRIGLSVPEDISVVGFDDIEMAKYLTPALTTVRQDTYVLGKRAADMLIYCIEGGSELQQAVIPVELVIRDSCRPL